MGHFVVKVDTVLWKISFRKYKFSILLYFKFVHYRNLDQDVCFYALINVLQYICQELRILFHFSLQVCSD